ncbi:nucleotide exchange factor GrpE [Bacillus sp. FJAT-42376]|uniref:nucleotide exchange factor GrpE n=1 Tax=Bacillus sp. FJAT-42376 TaxID=2014076 RepID=UPI000F4E6E51|nr:nucleotide exchange factor GrpE [Bacillus sp. FJAT-42376]AZB43682.1 nucleotide exchange factor GrpE [Bacillus sp. FJAT-42376]
MENEKDLKDREWTEESEGKSALSDEEVLEHDEAGEDSSETAEISETDSKIASLEAKVEETEGKLLRVQADFENFKRRSRMDAESAQKYRAQNLISEILPALDNFERALKVEASDDKTKSLLQGMEMVHRQLVQALKSEGVEEIETVGKPFDPHLHQAVMQAEEEGYEPNTVIEEFQKGYKLKDRVIRPSMVKVSQ